MCPDFDGRRQIRFLQKGGQFRLCRKKIRPVLWQESEYQETSLLKQVSNISKQSFQCTFRYFWQHYSTFLQLNEKTFGTVVCHSFESQSS